jgi:hypothetical protein
MVCKGSRMSRTSKDRSMSRLGEQGGMFNRGSRMRRTSKDRSRSKARRAGRIGLQGEQDE